MSFQHLRTVNGVIFQTYQGACKELGLLEGDEHWQNTMSDAIISEPATKLRELFTTILIFCQPSDPLELWNKFRDALCEDILNRMRNENQDMTLAYNDDIYNDGLIIIEDKIHEISDKSLTDFGLPAAKRNNSLLDPLEVALRKPYNLNDLNEYITENEPRLVNDQKDSVCSIRKNGPLGKVLQDVSLIIWDECTMIHRAHVEALDRTLRDIRNCDKIMGGITVMFAGDFRQTLPVIVREPEQTL
ncbi:hypothetical protein EVAR_87047_1 [Eumeta japonica]|uniref:ATP-dependent DNA helicase n=1 Tax=Eumeta variegata TaxID=151549 RepID=A0A4C1SM50_EUMVA|nr:hypothetical protein EVAR_87047_1 [Eumeta japonica]